MNKVRGHAVDITALLLAVVHCQAVTKIVDVGERFLTKTDIPGRNHRRRNGRKLVVRRGSKVKANMDLWGFSGRTEIGKVTPHLMDELTRGAIHRNRTAVEVEKFCHGIIRRSSVNMNARDA